MKTTITYKGIEFDVKFNYQKGEKAVYYPVDNAYPGTPAQVELIEITHKGTDFTEFLEDQTEEIENLILETI